MGLTETTHALTTAEKKRILLNNLYGVDLDQQAVEVTKLSLLLKVLEGETAASAHQPELMAERVLPDLDDNIKWGNSLIGPDYYTGKQMTLFDDESIHRVQAFDWHSPSKGFGKIMAAGGFDAVIGNPPYVRMEEFKDVKPYLRSNYVTHAERLDLYGYFIEREFKLLRFGGLFGMIVSNKFLKASYGAALRRFIVESSQLTSVLDLAGLPVFPDATVRTIVLTANRSENGTKQPVTYTPVMSLGHYQQVTKQPDFLVKVIEKTSYQVPSEHIQLGDWNFARPVCVKDFETTS